MKYLFIALILGAFCALIYWRLRPYINFARRVLGVVRKTRSMSVGQQTPDEMSRKRTGGDERLVRCASCGTWFPAARALTLRATSSNFCSHACMERSAGTQNAPRAAGNQR